MKTEALKIAITESQSGKERSSRGANEQARRCTVATMIRSDNDIQTDALDEFFWDPEIAAPDVGVQVHEGSVSMACAPSPTT